MNSSGKPTITKVEFCGREQAEDTPGRPDTAVISITDPGGTAKLQDGWGAVLRVAFMDYDLDSMVSPWLRGQAEKSGLAPTALHAVQIVNFVWHPPRPSITKLLVHCEAGVSRSAAVALWAWEQFGLVIRPADVHRHNRYLYRLLNEATQ